MERSAQEDQFSKRTATENTEDKIRAKRRKLGEAERHHNSVLRDLQRLGSDSHSARKLAEIESDMALRETELATTTNKCASICPPAVTLLMQQPEL